MSIQIHLWEIQAASLKKKPLNLVREINRKQAYYLITIYYGDLLRMYAEDFPQSGWHKNRKDQMQDMAKKWWNLITEQLMRALANEGVERGTKLIYHGHPGRGDAPTKIEAIMAVMNTHMECGLRHDNIILKMLSHHLWLQERLNLGND